jgi:putative ABC transport system permease protein
MPDWAAHVRARLASLRLSATRENDIVEELSQHLEERWCELIAGGASPDEATRLTLSDFRDGDVLARHMAALRQSHAPPTVTPGGPSGHWWSDLRQDLRYAGRTFRKRPAFTLAAVLTLALGIGSNATIFSVINAVLLQPLPFPHGARLLSLYTRFLPSSGNDFPYFSLSHPEYADVRARADAFAAIAAYSFESRNLSRHAGEADRVLTMRVTAGFFDVLGVKPERGRSFTEEEAQRGGQCVAVVSHGLVSTGAIATGSTIRLDDAPCEVLGVMPVGFEFRDDRVKVWSGLPIDPEDTPLKRWSHGLAAIARLREGVGREQAEAQLQSLRGYWSERFPDHYAKGHFAVSRPLHEDIVGDERDALLLLGAAVWFVLLIVCVNLAALLISNGEARRREFALRHALGADRRRLVRQMLVEALLLAVIGGGCGVLLGNALLAALLSVYPRRLPAGPPIAIDYPALLYTSALVVVAGFLVGIAPALSATGARMQEALRADSRAVTASRRAIAARSSLVVGQLALSVVLLVGALLLIRSYQRLQQVNLGIQPDRLLTFGVFIPPARQGDAAGARRTMASIEDRLGAASGVEIAGAISNLPLAAGGPPDGFVIEERPNPPPGAPAWVARYLMATPRAFRALGIPLKRGRLLDDGDVPGRPLVAVINETAARLYWPGEDPIGRTIRYRPRETNPSIEIVGIVGDVRSLGASEPAPPGVYVALAQAPRPSYEGREMTFVVRVAGDPAVMASSARAAVASIDAGLPLARVRPMSEVVAASVGQPRFTTIVMTFFASAAFLLGALGLYGILAHAVEQRVREIGVRVALGAGNREILRLILGSGMRLALLGAGIGVLAALALTRLMSGLLSGVTSTDPVTYAAVVGMLASSALLASYLPARRAMRVDPIVALRTD